MFTRDYGKISVVDKGGRRFKSRRGRLVSFARLEITFYKSEKSPTGYLSDAELLELFGFEQDGTVGRLAYASAACEILNALLSDEEPQPELFSQLVTFLRMAESVRKGSLPAVFLAFLLGALTQLGYQPSLDACAGCGRKVETVLVEADAAQFSPERGGIICGPCQKAGEYYIRLSCTGARHLAALLKATLSEAVTVPIGYSEVTGMLEALMKFANYTKGAVSKLKSLQFLEKLRNNHRANDNQSGST
jgi:DNA repair protein RecO